MNKSFTKCWKVITGGGILALSLVAASQATIVASEGTNQSKSICKSDTINGQADAYLFFSDKTADTLKGTINYNISGEYLNISAVSPTIDSGSPWSDLTLLSSVTIDVEGTPKTYPIGSILGYAFSGTGINGSLTISKGIKSVASYAFKNCTELTSIDMGDGLNSVGQGSFQGCSNLTTVHFGSGLYAISQEAFRSCTSLTTINFPTNLQFIHARAFEDCTGLSSVDLPNGLVQVGYNAFSRCTGLEQITLDPQLSIVGSMIVGLSSTTGGTHPLNVKFRKGFDYTALTDPNLFPDACFSNVDATDDQTPVARNTNRPITFMVPNSQFSEFESVIKAATWYKKTEAGDDIDGFNDPTGVLNADQVFSGDPQGTVCYQETGANEISLIPTDGNGDYTIVTGTNLTLNSTVQIGNELYNVTGIADNTFVNTEQRNNNLSGYLSFKNCDYLTSIGDYAFSGQNITSLEFTQCIHLSSIGVSAFSSSKTAGQVNLTECTNLTTISESAFADSQLSSLLLPSSITTTGANVLNECANLKAVSFPWTSEADIQAVYPTWNSSWLGDENIASVNSIVPLGYVNTYKDDEVKSHLGISNTNITDTYDNYETPSTFFDNAENASGYVCYEIVDPDLKTIRIVNHDTTYGHFTSSVSGQNLKLKNSVQIGEGTYNIVGIDANAFVDDNNLTGILDLSQNVSLTGIGANAFDGCTNLQGVNLSNCNSLASIGADAFGGCDLTKITVPNSWKTKTNGNFVAHEYEDRAGHTIGMMVSQTGSDTPVGCLAYGAIQFNDPTKQSIPEGAFASCAGITSVDLSTCTGLTTIYKNAFINCINLSSVNISSCNQLTAIDEYSFASCYNLNDLEFPASLQTINTNAFADCYDLVSISLPASITSVAADAFVMHEGYRSRLNTLTLNWTDPLLLANLNADFLGNKDTFPTNVQAVYVPEEAYDAFDGTIQSQGWWISGQMTLANIPVPTPTPVEENSWLGVVLGVSIGAGISLVGIIIGWVCYAYRAEKYWTL